MFLDENLTHVLTLLADRARKVMFRQERGGAIIRERLICLIVLVVASYIVNVLRTHFQFGLNGVAKFLTSKQAFSENEAFN